MAKGAKLKDALDRQKGIDHKLEKQKRLQKKALKRKRSRTEVAEDGSEVEGDETELQFHTPKASRDEKTPKSKRQKKDALAASEEVSDDEIPSPDGSEDWETADEELEKSGFDLSRLQDSDTSDSEDDQGDDLNTPTAKTNGHALNGDAEQDDNEDEEDDEDIPLSDIESLASDEKEDVVPHQRLTINNTVALTKAYKSIALPASLPFSATQAVVSSAPTIIADIEDDLGRELAFYKQSLEAVTQARSLLKKEGVLFSRPADYFAEMVKSDEHMGKIKKKLVDDAASKKAAAEARKQRDLKKFGKQVQIAKLQERDKAKKETLDKIKMLKKKRSGASIGNANEDDMFDVALEDAAVTEKKDKAARKAGGGTGPPGAKRQKKNDKWGYGGKKRFAKSNDAESSADTRSFSIKKMKGKTQRPGKSRRSRPN
ncbi:eukaryotic rRNA processing protein EBP2-domain-containing protein [Elsinoe ampelina]|uniref:Eukaryotic rRNA processing protein EBP2-domain-containing protein n=1 Tax=Elsinoe ampelina TaxID=302913 RepID=A0A6A6GJJ5_9PEZI|nr:eukaryotic rRNA processing protein EBP2-domain-containing protein [Elsinoe ampelina]